MVPRASRSGKESHPRYLERPEAARQDAFWFKAGLKSAAVGLSSGLEPTTRWIQSSCQAFLKRRLPTAGYKP